MLIVFGDRIALESHTLVRKLLALLEQEPIADVRNLHPGYCSLLVTFDLLKLGHAEVEHILRGYMERLEDLRLPEPRLVEIPVCYGGEFGEDLQAVAALHGIALERVVELHTAAEYTVYFLGFVPGFAYLGELPEGLITPRLATPRRVVPPGSVGIAGRQTGVYPLATPGGWRLLGRTPVPMLRRNQNPLSLLAVGDRVRFRAISSAEFVALQNSQGGV